MENLFQEQLSLVAVAGFGLFVLAMTTVVYRLAFDTLAAYPGPFLAKFTNLYTAYHLIRGNLQVQQRLLHQRYGPVVRIGPKRLMFNSQPALSVIYQSRNLQKSAAYTAMSPLQGHPTVFSAVDKKLHRMKRKALSPGFSDQFIRKFEQVILTGVDEFVQEMTPRFGEWSQPQNMSTRCMYFTLDVMGVFGFGRSFNLQTEEKFRGIENGMHAGGIIGALYGVAPSLRRFGLEKYIKFKGSWTQAKWGAFVREMITERVKLARDARLDLFSFVIEVKDEDTGVALQVDDLWAESRLFLTAGSDTSSTALSSLLFYLSRYPQTHQRLLAEIQKTFASYDEIRLGPALSSCHYLRAAIDESMRLSPPVGAAMWREVCEGGQVIDDHFIPPGIDVGVSMYSLFHSESIYPQPDTFIPERFLEDGPFPEHVHTAKAAFKPFSLGTRNCAGMNLAYAEMTVFVAKVLWALDFKIPNGPEGRIGEGTPDSMPGRRLEKEFQLSSYITSQHEGPYLQFRPRVAAN